MVCRSTVETGSREGVGGTSHAQEPVDLRTRTQNALPLTSSNSTAPPTSHTHTLASPYFPSASFHFPLPPLPLPFSVPHPGLLCPSLSLFEPLHTPNSFQSNTLPPAFTNKGKGSLPSPHATRTSSLLTGPAGATDTRGAQTGNGAVLARLP